MSAKPGTNARTCPVGLAGLPCTMKNPRSAKPASGGRIRQARGGFGRGPAGNAERRDVHPAQRQPRRHGSGYGHADRDPRMSGKLSASSAGKNGWPMNGMPATGMRSRKKIPKPSATPATPATLDSAAATPGDLPGGRADQAHRREPLLAAGGRQPGRGSDEDQHRGQDGQRHHGQEEVDGTLPAASVRRDTVQPLGVHVRPRSCRVPSWRSTSPARCRAWAPLRRSVPDDDDHESGDGSPASPIIPARWPG